ncbi:beta 1-4 rhamnosyltransferase Cps2T [Inconstantimicrobium mannanitabidum]|uniref:Rhamnosyltransferase n=1 Tax=Inconstantimicrobium mannanitabidum TaxID=1604901 RepID=A0ACB5RFG0_9CLOT|nr:DUF1972 domain-containing protein [Clostridium sp. TW13]GKX67817.1 rhamnosyltransferase [Clostridium sp. TW13]
MKNVFIIGSKGIPANYGGYETFVHKLTEKKISKEIKYHVACMANDDKEFEVNGARCFNVKVTNIGNAKAILYDINSIKCVCKYIEENNIKDAILYILACRIGPFMKHYKKKLQRLGVTVYINPDGHEWMRSKWNAAIKKYWKVSEKLMVKHADLVICDSVGIQDYIKKEYREFNPKTTFIAYGSDVEEKNEKLSAEAIRWYNEKSVKKGEYYLIVGRFVPENNYETMISEFMRSNSDKDLIIITNVEKNKFYDDLVLRTAFDKDSRIKFVGTVYDEKLLKEIRDNAYAYIHGHEVGGTNPSLLEALASTRINLLLDVVFNREVGRDGAVYFTKEPGNLGKLINEVDMYDIELIDALEKKAKARILNHYSWNYIVKEYEKQFL